MKKLIYILLCIFPLFVSCDKDSSSADYYVRYEYSYSNSSVMGGSKIYSKTISVNTDSGIKDFTTTGNSFSETFGPFKKGFNASISVKYTDGGGGGNTNLKIYVSRSNEPFVLKAINEQYSTSISYTIDY